MNLQFECKRAELTPNSTRAITLEIEDATPRDVLNNFNINQIVDYFGVRELLDAIGQGEAEKHFDLVPNENED